MMDFLEIRVKGGAQFSPEFSEIGAQLRRGEGADLGARNAPHYASMLDLRPLGFDSVAFFSNRNTGDHKLSVVDVGMKGFDEVRHEIRRVFDVDPDAAEVMRMDLCSDVKDVPVPWFRDNGRWQYKRFGARISKGAAEDLEYLEMGRGKLETIYAGKRPNCIRCYDKGAELWHSYKKYLRDCAVFERGAVSTGACDRVCVMPPLSFEQWSAGQYLRGIKQGEVITRVERQMGGGRVPERVDTLKKFVHHSSDFNPFDRMRITDGGVGADPIPDLPAMDGRSMRQWLQLYGYQCLSRKLGGAQFAASFVTANANGHGGEILKSFENLAAVAEGVTVAEIFEKYRDTVRRQIAS